MGMSSRHASVARSVLMVMWTVSPCARTEDTSASRAAYRWDCRARSSVAATSRAVRAEPSEKVTPLRSVSV